MATAARHVYGPRPVGALIPGLTRPAFHRNRAAIGFLLTDWPVIVGPALAAVTMPRRLQSGVLTIACAGPIALELQHLADELLGRVNRHIGRDAVTRLRCVQDVDLAAAAPAAASAPRLRASPAAARAAEQATSRLPPGPLRDALAALGRAVLR